MTTKKTIAAFAALTLLAGSAAAGTQCPGTITIGEGPGKVVTPVANRPIDNACLDALIIDTLAEGANYGSHGDFVAAVTRLAAQWKGAGHLDGREHGQLVSAAARSRVGKTLQLRVIAFNDFHGNIDGANLSFRSDVDGIVRVNADGTRSAVPAGGVDYLAGLVKQLRAGAPNSVVVSAGDLIGASPLNSALFHDEPTIETMFGLGTEQLGGEGDVDSMEDRLVLLREVPRPGGKLADRPSARSSRREDL